MDVELLGAEPHFWYRPLSVAEPFELAEVRRYELAALAVAAGARFTLGTLLGVDASSRAAGRRLETSPTTSCSSRWVPPGHSAVPGALTFRGPAESEKVVALLGEIDAGDVRRVGVRRACRRRLVAAVLRAGADDGSAYDRAPDQGRRARVRDPGVGTARACSATRSAQMCVICSTSAGSPFTRARVPPSTGTACSGSGRKASSRSTESSRCRDCAAGGSTGFLRLRTASSRSTPTGARSRAGRGLRGGRHRRLPGETGQHCDPARGCRCHVNRLASRRRRRARPVSTRAQGSASDRRPTSLSSAASFPVSARVSPRSAERRCGGRRRRSPAGTSHRSWRASPASRRLT